MRLLRPDTSVCKSTIGMATVKPSTVVTSACEMPPAISFGSPVPNRVMAWKVTIMPVQRIERAAPSMRYRGRLSVGAFADITVFDPNTIIDRATYLEPDQYSEGVHYVLVNGTVVLDQGDFVEGVPPGRPVRRGE